MSNLGLERLLTSKGIGLVRAQVGDRYVMEAMRAGGYNIGGEQSGHIVLSDYSTTGDGLLGALQVLALIKQQGKPASQVLNLFKPLPQILRNVKFETKEFKPLDDSKVQDAIKKAQDKLTKGGRLLVRASGTESVIRVMAEGDDAAMIENVVGDLCAVIEKAARA